MSFIKANYLEAQFSAEEFERYQQHFCLPGVGLYGQQKLKSAKVLIIGMGGLGSPVSLYLTAAGVGEIGLIDDDQVDRSNLQRQIIYGIEDLGKYKVECAKTRLQNINPHVMLNVHTEPFTKENGSQLVSAYDIIVDGTDNFESHYLINDICVRLEKPFVYGSVFQGMGQISTVLPKQGPCFRCLFPSPPPKAVVPSCSESGVLGVVPGLIGILQANEVLKLILELGESLKERVILFDQVKSKFKEFHLPRDENCTACGDGSDSIKLSERVSPPNQEQGLPFLDEISAEEFVKFLKLNKNILILDVRQKWEYEMSRIQNAKLIPLGDLAHRYLELNRDDVIVVYCHSGIRSKSAVDFLQAKGFSKAKNLRGGIIAYNFVDRS